jgi:hypothetical protein
MWPQPLQWRELAVVRMETTRQHPKTDKAMMPRAIKVNGDDVRDK